MLALRSLFFTLLVPGTVVILIPYLILSQEGRSIPGRWGPNQFLSLVPVLLGAAILLRCIWDFAAKGRGTLAPVDPPKELVVKGLYRYVRNPMYWGVLVLLLGEAAFFESGTLLWYTALWFIAVNLVVVLFEEPALRRRFGTSYNVYCQTVHRWIPGKGA
jgi:protein-S-isoprenylcysteine O-methyltransferase Ste14